jgi:hypothetical protein
VTDLTIIHFFYHFTNYELPRYFIRKFKYQTLDIINKIRREENKRYLFQKCGGKKKIYLIRAKLDKDPVLAYWFGHV